MQFSKRFLVAVSILGLISSAYLVIRLTPLFLETLGIKKGSEKTLAPDFALLDLEGASNELSDFRGKNIILNFWTSWNEISVNQLKVLDSYYRSASKDNLAIFAVNSEEDVDSVKMALNKIDVAVPIFLDDEGEIGELYSISVLPMTVFINKTGFVIQKIIGPATLEEVNNFVKDL